jgi:hypothetical protein
LTFRPLTDRLEDDRLAASVVRLDLRDAPRLAFVRLNRELAPDLDGPRVVLEVLAVEIRAGT